MSQLFALGSQSIGASASASVLPVIIQGWFRLGLFGGFYRGSDGKESTCNVGDLGLISGLERSPEGRPRQSTPVCLPGESQWSLEGYSPWGCKELDTTECLSTTQDWLLWSPHTLRDPHKSSPAPQFEIISSLMLSLLYVPTLTSICDDWKYHSFDCTDLYW